MKKIMAVILLIVAFSASNAFARPSFWTCKLDFHAQAEGLQFFVGNFRMEGEGSLKCINVFGEVEVLPISIEMNSRPISLRFAFGKFEIHGTSLNVTLARDNLDDLMGEYRTVSVQGSREYGVGAFAATKVGDNGISFNVTVQTLTGTGLNVGYSTLEFSPL